VWRCIATVRPSPRASAATTCSRTVPVIGRAPAPSVCTTAATAPRHGHGPSATRSTTRTAATTTTTDTATAAATRPSAAGTASTARSVMVVMTCDCLVVELLTARSYSSSSFRRNSSARSVSYDILHPIRLFGTNMGALTYRIYSRISRKIYNKILSEK